jgi:hypothetical protein
MGVLFICVEKEYSCAYGSWNIVRNEMATATMRYLESLVDITNAEKMHENKLICDILTQKENLTKGVDEFLETMYQNKRFINQFIELNIYGLYALLNKADDHGFYSPGNSKDIILLIRKIKPFIEVENVLERIPGIRKMLRESVKKNHHITIM